MTRQKRIAAAALVGLHLFQICYAPVPVQAQGGGNDQAGSVEALGQLVDLSTGDFSYSIPLMNVEGYPITLNYQAGVQLNQEASWVGLGWSLTPGAVQRQMRGIPDDFRGDPIVSEYNQKRNETYGGEVTLGREFVGMPAAPMFKLVRGSLGAEAFYNTYTGFGFTRSLSLSRSLSGGTNIGVLGVSGDLGYSLNNSVGNQTGVTQNANFSVGLGGSFPVSQYLGGSINGRLGYNYSSDYNSIRGFTNESSRLYASASLSLLNGSFTPAGVNHQLTGSFTKAPLSFTPKITFPRNSEGLSLYISAGAIFYGAFTWAGVKAFSLVSEFTHKTQTNPAFGTMFLQAMGNQEPIAIQDFNREYEKQFRNETTVLPYAYMTNDHFITTAAGMNFMFKTKRNDLGVFSDNRSITKGDNEDLEFEYGVGYGKQIGTNTSSATTSGSSGKWDRYFGLTDLLAFRGNEGVPTDFEPYYFKRAGEITAPGDLYSLSGGNTPVRFDLEKQSELDYSPTQRLVYSEGESILLNQNHSTQREARNTVIYALDAQRAGQVGLVKQIEHYPVNNFGFTDGSYARNTLSRVTLARNKTHHMSEVHVTDETGNRYVYGIPVYNRTHVEKSFNVYDRAYDWKKGLVQYAPGSDNTPFNTRGTDHFYGSKRIPDYAQSFLISAVLSPHYEDVTQNGPTPDDIGSYTKFNYSRFDSAYQYRYPFDTNQAYFNQGFYADRQDDKGSYVHGQKEVWYLHSIEGKNYLAEFELNDPTQGEYRLDALGAAGENGGRSTQQVRYLKEIRLYHRADKLENGSSAKPLKTVRFTYDHSLCKGAPRSATGEGKLTLKEVEILDHRSLENEGKTYRFHYDYNPDYAHNAKDRWGCYKPQRVSSHFINSAAFRSDDVLSNAEYSYAEQVKDSADLYASAWNMTRIETPQGSELEVTYESDDYTHVQQKKAMQMYTVKGFLNGSGQSVTTLYEGATKPHVFMLVGLGGDTISRNEPQPHKTLIADFLHQKDESNGLMQSMYYKVYTNMINREGYEDYVTGYAQVDALHARAVRSSAGGPFDHALIPVEFEVTDGMSVNPISRMAWQVAGDYLSRYVIDGSHLGGQGFNLSTIVHAIEGQQEQKRVNSQGFYRYMANEQNGQLIYSNRSFVRMYKPGNGKLGGGHRVKKIVVKDQWEAFSDQYGVEYSYTRQENGEVRSSGVASGEPQAGGDENALRFSRDDLLMRYPGMFGKSNIEFVEFPFSEHTIPNPRVVYARVQSKSIQKQQVSLTRTGSTIHEFYTARDFPMRYAMAPLEKYVRQPDPKVDFFNAETRAVLTFSHGMSMVLNDMHGKPRKVKALDEQGQFISSVEYLYRTQNNGRLDNVIPTVDEQGAVTNRLMGIDMDAIIDSREVHNKAFTRQHQANVVLFPAPVGAPISLIPVLSYFTFRSEDETTLRTLNFCKIIEQYGILDRIITKDERSVARFSHEVYDATTGIPTVTSTNNFLNPSKNYMSYRYPAYWNSTYARMGPAYPTIGISTRDVLNPSSKIVDPNFQTIGTEVHAEWLVGGSAQNQKLWVSYDAPSGTYEFIQQNGQAFDPGNAQYNPRFTIIRPGEANYLHTDAQNMTLMRPATVNHGANYQATSLTETQQASAVTFRDQARVYGVLDQDANCMDESGQGELINDTTDQVNPYLLGIRNNWSSDAVYAYKADRGYNGFTASTMGSVQLNNDGFFPVEPLYYCTGSGLVQDTQPATGWVTTSQITQVVNQNNQALETRDLVGVHHSISTNWNGTNLHAQTSTSKKREHYFEDFEDAGVLTNYFNLGNNAYNDNLLHYNNQMYHNGRWTERIEAPDTNYAHTGTHSLRIASGEFNGIACSVTPELARRSENSITVPYALRDTDLELGFYLDPADEGRVFTVSFWMARAGYQRPYSVEGVFVYGKSCEASQALSVTADTEPEKQYESPMIDGWKQVSYDIRIPNIGPEFYMTFQFQNPYAEAIYIDDIRIHPKEAHMVSSVVQTDYGWQHAVLDENNFSVQYRYDSKGRVSGIMRETERGKQTISTTRQSIED